MTTRLSIDEKLASRAIDKSYRIFIILSMIKPTVLSKNIGDKIAKLRRQRDITQYELAVKTKFNHTYINRLEKGRYLPRIQTLYKIAKAFNISINELLDF